jgi:antitoxin component HigA of HigAB toxin-antitoxin module
MTKEEILGLDKLENAEQWDEAVELLDTYILERFNTLTNAEHDELNVLADLIYDYEELNFKDEGEI